MSSRPRNRKDSSRKSDSESDRDGKLIAGKNGVYMVLGDEKLRSFQLVPWEQMLCSLPPARR